MWWCSSYALAPCCGHTCGYDVAAAYLWPQDVRLPACDTTQDFLLQVLWLHVYVGSCWQLCPGVYIHSNSPTMLGACHLPQLLVWRRGADGTLHSCPGLLTNCLACLVHACKAFELNFLADHKLNLHTCIWDLVWARACDSVQIFTRSTQIIWIETLARGTCQCGEHGIS